MQLLCLIVHFLQAPRKLKPIPTAGVTLYRGIDGKHLKFDDDHYKVGNALSWPAFTSTTTNPGVVYDHFLKKAALPIIFEISGEFVGYSVKAFSKFSYEDEVLLEPETRFRVVSILRDARNVSAKRIVVIVTETTLIKFKDIEGAIVITR